SRRPTTPRTDSRPACGPTRARASCRWPTSSRPASCGPTRSTSSIPPARSAGSRSPATAGRAVGTAWRPIWRPTSRTGSADGPHRRTQDLQALHRGRVPPLGVGPLLRGDRRRREVRGQRVPGLAQGRPRRGRRRAQGVRRLVGADGLQPRADRLPHRRGDGGPAPAVRHRRAPGRGPDRRPCRAGRRRRVRPTGLVRRLGRQADPGRGQRQPRRRAVLQPLDPRAHRRRRGARAAGVLPPRAGQLRGPGDGHRLDRRGGVLVRAAAAVGAVLAPQESSLLGLVSVVAPVIVTGNPAVVVSSYERPLPAVNFDEVLATSDVPGGVVNILTGAAPTIGPWLASHMDVNAIDLAGVAGDAALATDLEVAAADNLKRVRRAPAAEPDWNAEPPLTATTDFVEIKTVWHPIGV